jgi:conjugal transfer ATP-binding protein TraC
MAAPNDKLDDYRMSALGEGIKAEWGRMGTKMTVTDVAAYLSKHEDQRVRDLGTMLFPFTRQGEYGSWFDGDNNLEFSRDYVVLELEELNAKRHLQQVVLLMLITKIQHEMFLSDLKGDARKKLLVIDEAWALLDDPGVGRFMETGYRRFRKYGGAALLCTQSLDEFYKSESGRAIAANSAFFLIMQQRAESIVAIQESKRLDLDEYTIDAMKTVHSVTDPKAPPGRRYSECMFYTPRGVGIGRLVVEPLSQVVYSSSGEERTVLLQQLRAGMSPEEALATIKDFMNKRKRAA